METINILLMMILFDLHHDEAATSPYNEELWRVVVSANSSEPANLGVRILNALS